MILRKTIIILANIYLWLMVVISFSAIFYFKQFHFVDVIDYVLVNIGLVGMFGLLYKKKLGPKWVWQGLFIVIVAFTLIFNLFIDARFGGFHAYSNLQETLGGMLIKLPMLIAIYFYAFGGNKVKKKLNRR